MTSSTTSTRTEDFTAVLNLPASPADVLAVVLTHCGLPSTHLGDHRTGWEHQLGRLPAAAG